MARQPSFDMFSWYLGEAGKMPLLTREEEIALAKVFDAGKKPMLLRDEIKEQWEMELREPTLQEKQRIARLMPKIKLAEQARQTLIERNMRLVVSIAQRHVGKSPRLTAADLIGEGNLGLIRGVEGFDWKRGYKLVTYATWWIRQAIQSAFLNQARVVRIPRHIEEDIARYNKARRALGCKFSREPMEKEIAKKLGWSIAKVSDIRSVMREDVSMDFLSLDEGEGFFMSLIADTREMSASQAEDLTARKQVIMEVLENIDERDRLIIYRRFGLGEEEIYTLKKIGEDLGVTRERIRQIEGRILKMLRNHKKVRQLVSLE